MRLRSSDIDAIRHAIQSVLDRDYRIRLFGSRLDDRARGGDVDLMVEFDHPVESPAQLSARLAVRTSRALGGRKVDVVISAPNLLDSDIHRIAREEGVLL